jgi:outer membrane protein assembly factor BamE (lipoprotein component of BamABCDE complex)
MRTRVSRTLLLLTVLATACTPPNKKATDEFVVQYLNSIVQQSDFYRSYSTEHDVELIALARPQITSEFHISNWDYVPPGHHEYSVSFSNGAVAVVGIEEHDGAVKSATLTIARQPNHR